MKFAARLAIVAVVLAMCGGCARTVAVNGTGTIGVAVVGDSHSAFDDSAANVESARRHVATGHVPRRGAPASSA